MDSASQGDQRRNAIPTQPDGRSLKIEANCDGQTQKVSGANTPTLSVLLRHALIQDVTFIAFCFQAHMSPRKSSTYVLWLVARVFPHHHLFHNSHSRRLTHPSSLQLLVRISHLLPTQPFDTPCKTRAMIANGTGTPIAIFVDVLRLVAGAEVDDGVAVDVHINIEVVGEELKGWFGCRDGGGR